MKNFFSNRQTIVEMILSTSPFVDWHVLFTTLPIKYSCRLACLVHNITYQIPDGMSCLQHYLSNTVVDWHVLFTTLPIKYLMACLVYNITYQIPDGMSCSQHYLSNTWWHVLFTTLPIKYLTKNETLKDRVVVNYAWNSLIRVSLLLTIWKIHRSIL